MRKTPNQAQFNIQFENQQNNINILYLKLSSMEKCCKLN